MPANLENSAVATGLEEVSFHSNPKEKEMQKAKWLSEEAEKWREVKGKGEKEGYTHLNEEFQRTERRGKKDLLKDQCKEQRKTIEWERLEISSWKL